MTSFGSEKGTNNMQQCSETEHCSSVGLKDRNKQLKALGASEQPSDHLSLVKARKKGNR